MDRTIIKCNIDPTKPKGLTKKAPKPPQAKSSNSLEDLLKAYMEKNDAMIQIQVTTIQSQVATLKNLENQMGQLAIELRSRPQGALPNDTKNFEKFGSKHQLDAQSIFKLLRIGEVRPTTVTLQLVDRLLEYLEGKIEDILVRVDKFIFATDFIVLDFEADKEVPIILGRPFLATEKNLIDVSKGELIIRVEDDKNVYVNLGSLSENMEDGIPGRRPISKT
ncbi:uncharacterized protein LOC105781573 [Gossypium raimondii]|uniref:uncharacterized protein LOC105781573 n=1 Tax=Gossypium raimondii TaxID=29730 RepID=UPI00063AEA5B|nr:uncharacterized protein LOC105781573 [Gossypium raimondii]